MPPLLTLLVRGLACAGAAWLAWTGLGAVGLALVAPLFGIAFAKPILDLLGDGTATLRRLALRDVEGRHYEFKGIRVDVIEDGACHRWLRVADVRKIIRGLPADAVLQNLLPGGVQVFAPSATVRIRAEALMQYLQKSTDPGSLRFKLWLEQEVVLPGRKRREQAGDGRVGGG